jgi:hypothetical protein
MSETGVITKQDLAEMVVQARRQKSVANTVLLSNLVHALWTEFGAVQRENSLSEKEADQILNELPYEYDDIA